MAALKVRAAVPRELVTSSGNGVGAPGRSLFLIETCMRLRHIEIRTKNEHLGLAC